MAFYSLFGETRSRPTHTFNVSDVSGDRFVLSGNTSMAGETVTEDSALGVPAIASAINVISGTIASLPILVFKKTDEGRVKADKDTLYRIVHDVVNSDYLTSYQWRKWAVSRLLLTGRCFTFIEKNKAGRVMNLWPLNDLSMVVTLDDEGRKVYTYNDGGKTNVFTAGEIIDLIREPGADATKHKNPLHIHRHTIGEMIAAQRSASAMFESGGIPAHLLKIPNGSPESQTRAFESVFAAMKNMRAKKQPLLPLVENMDIKVLGLDPKSQQMLELRSWQITEVARIYNIPPSFLQDHSRSTFSNVEQLNLHYSQHTILPLITMIEAELNVKLTSDRNRDTYVEFVMDGLERGDKKSQYEGFQVGIHGGFLTPNEVRGWLNLPSDPNGDKLFIQSATVPIADAGKTPEPAPEDKSEEEPDPAEPEEDNDQ